MFTGSLQLWGMYISSLLHLSQTQRRNQILERNQECVHSKNFPKLLPYTVVACLHLLAYLYGTGCMEIILLVIPLFYLFISTSKIYIWRRIGWPLIIRKHRTNFTRNRYYIYTDVMFTFTVTFFATTLGFYYLCHFFKTREVASSCGQPRTPESPCASSEGTGPSAAGKKQEVPAAGAWHCDISQMEDMFCFFTITFQLHSQECKKAQHQLKV